jgi:hypothetical protein
VTSFAAGSKECATRECQLVRVVRKVSLKRTIGAQIKT